MQLYNKLSAEERARIIDENSQERITLSFYKYFKLGNPKLFRDHLFVTWSKLYSFVSRENPKEDLIQLKKDMLTSDFTPDHKHIRVSGLKSVKFKPETLTRI